MTKTAVSEILSKAADLLEKPGAGTQGGSAFDASGNPVGYGNPAAASWCVEGAIGLAASNLCEVDRAFRAVKRRLGIRSLYRWNDTPGRTQAEVVAVLRTAASQAGEQA